MSMKRNKLICLFISTIIFILLLNIIPAYAVHIPEELARAKQIYFDRCAGCHGTLRKGATGPEITHTRLKEKNYNTQIIKVFVSEGTGAGMPGWKGILTDEEIDEVSEYLQIEPPIPPELSLPDMELSWKLIVPTADRPMKPQHNRDWQNFFGVILRDAGKVAIIDGEEDISTPLEETAELRLLTCG